MARWLTRRGARVRVADSRAAPPCRAAARELPGVELHTGAFRAESFADADLIAISPGRAAWRAAVAQAARRGGLESSATSSCSRRLRDEFPGVKVLAITGSNGKSTVTEMVGAMCAPRRPGRSWPAISACRCWTRCRRSSRTGRRRASRVVRAGAVQLPARDHAQPGRPTWRRVLNLSEDHLDRYASMHDYAAAKARIFLGDGVQVLNRQDAWTRGMAGPAARY